MAQLKAQDAEDDPFGGDGGIIHAAPQ